MGTPVSPAGRRLLVFFKISCPVRQLAQPFEPAWPRRSTRRADLPDDAELTPYFLRQFASPAPTLIDDEAAGYPVSNAYGIEQFSIFLVNGDDLIEAATSGFVKADFAALGGPTCSEPAMTSRLRPGCGANN